jgi:F-type H+-transporting ATPase subunit b
VEGLPGDEVGHERPRRQVQGDLDAAEQAKADAEAIRNEYEAKLADAKAESGRIIEEARQSADQLKADQQARLNEELANARAAAQADIDAAKGQAMSELRGEVASIAIGAAETVVGANLDREAQTRLIEDYINRVQSTGAQSGSQG